MRNDWLAGTAVSSQAAAMGGTVSTSQNKRAQHERPLHRPREYDTAPMVVSLRPVNDHSAMRRAAAVHGLRVLALSPWRIAVRDDIATRNALDLALAASIVIVTSPAAARAAATLATLQTLHGQVFYAIGTTTATTLRRMDVVEVLSPARMDSEGLLALPTLRDVRGRDIGLLTAPGGRNMIASTLRERGANVHRADVYAREIIALSPSSLARLRAFDGPLLLPVSSGEALQHVLDQAPADIAARLRGARVIAASARLAALAHGLGCGDVQIAAGPRPAQLLDAATPRSG